MPRNPGSFSWDTRGRVVERQLDGKCHRKQTARAGNGTGKGEKVR